MDQVKKKLAALKEGLFRSKKKTNEDLGESVNQLDSHLVLLKSLTLSAQAATKLIGRFRRPLAQTYQVVPELALGFTAQLAQFLYEDKVLSAYTSGNTDDKARWEAVLNALLAGVLDFLDENYNARIKETIGSVLYPSLCAISFSLSMSHMSVQLRSTAYCLLSDAASAHKPNQDRLRDSTYLGGSKLGAQIWRTKDFLVLEALLNLFARMLPTANDTASGRARRNAFIANVFLSASEHTAAGEGIAKILEDVPTSDWEQTAIKLFQALADYNGAFPQPFETKEVIACQKGYPSDRIFLDDKGFFANVVLEVNQYESLEVPYTAVKGINISYDDKETSQPKVQVDLALPPTLGKESVLGPSQYSGDSFTLVFLLGRADALRFQQVLNSRGIGQLLRPHKSPKLSLAESAASLEVDMTGGRLIGKEERYENVSQLYGTNDPSDDTTEQDVSISVSNILVGLSVPASPKAQQDEPKKGEKTPSEATKNFDNGKASCTVLETQAVSIDAFCAKVTATKSKPLRRTTSQAIREAVFGSSDEELSEIDSPTPAPPKVPSRSKSQRCNSSAPKRAQGRIVLDSDEEEIVTSARPAKATISKKKHVESSEDEIEEILSPPMLLSISRRPSALNLVPVTPACRTTEMVRTSETLRPNVASSRTDSKKGYPLALATDTAIVISGRSTRSRSSLKAASVSKDPDPSKSAVSSIPQPPITVNLGPLEAPLDINAEDSNTEKASKRNGVHRGSGKHVAFSSSPIASTKCPRKSVKDSLRKKGQQPTDSVKGSPQQAPKRKRGLSDSDAPDLSSPTTRASKRARNMKPDSGNNPVPSELTGSQVLRPRRTAATRATKRYRGRKNKSSSPAPSGSPGVDFDEIPGDSASMQPSEQAMALPEDPKPVARIGRQPRKTRTTAKARKEIPADLGVKAEPPKVEKRGRKPKLLRPPPTELNGQKPPSDSDLPTQDESMQDELLSPPSQEGWCLDLKPDTVGTVADLVRGDSQKDAGVDIKVIATTKQLPPGETQISHSTNKERSVKKSNKAPWLNIPAKSTPRDVRQDFRRSSMTHRSELNLTPRPTPMPIPVPKAPMPTNDRPLKPPVLVVGSSKRSLPLLEVVTTGQSKPAVDSREVLHIASANATNITQQSKMTPPEEVRDSDYSTHTLTIEDRNKPTEPETIDLTQDTPPKQLPPAKEKKTTISPPAAMSTISAKPDLKPLPETPRVVFKQPLFPPPDRRETSHLQKMPQALRMPARPDLEKSKMVREIDQTPVWLKPPRAGTSKHPGLEDVAAVLDEINEAILRNMSGKMDTVKTGSSAAKARILSQAAADLAKMHFESTERFNRLITLEAQYADYGRKLTHALDDCVQFNQNVCDDLQKIIHAHDRTSSMKLPKSLFPNRLPRSISKYLQ